MKARTKEAKLVVFDAKTGEVYTIYVVHDAEHDSAEFGIGSGIKPSHYQMFITRWIDIKESEGPEDDLPTLSEMLQAAREEAQERY